jgi:arabinofuranosyltransferase
METGSVAPADSVAHGGRIIAMLAGRLPSARILKLCGALLLAGGLAYISYMILIKAWVAEDAYITFRVIDNFMNGYGLRWNIHERVQVYTHPLWLLLHLPLYAVWDNLYYVTIALSIACTLGALAITLLSVRRSALVTVCCFLLPLGLSKSFMDYTTSGLENPLSYLLFALFGWIILKKQASPYFWFYSSLATSLAMLNRLDAVILYGPVMLYMLYQQRGWRYWRQIVLGAMPLIAWFYFALFYYGFIFPNTKYAKLNTGLDHMRYLQQGLRYAWFLLVKDTAGCIVLLSSLAFMVSPRTFSGGAPVTLPRLPAFVALGVYGNYLYTIYIGGDYMAGRFWAFPVFASAWLWYAFMPLRPRLDILFLIACLLLTASQLPPLFEKIRQSCSECIPLQGRVMDAIHTFNRNRLVLSTDPLHLRKQGRYPFRDGGLKLASKPPPTVEAMRFIGMVGYYAGPKVTIIDEVALADPLLARLPARRQSFYIGHFRRNIPKGYKQALETGSLSGMEPPLARYYEKLRLITSGNLLDKERLKTILLFNLGAYDHWKEEYLNSQP